MPTVYEFCSHVVANGDAGQLICDSSQCQGSPGEIGPTGAKGQKGEQGTAENLEERIRELEDSLTKTNQIIDALPRSTYCYMGMRSRDIPDSAITASSIYDEYHQAYHGRLDNRAKTEDCGRWSPKKVSFNQKGEWLQVDFGRSELVGGIITQGRDAVAQWVASFTVSCGLSTSSLATIQESGVEKIFAGNSDVDTKVINMFPKPITCRFIRVHPQTWYIYINMRVEFIKGVCYDLYI
uniref:lactadherin-like n=1 Tax=Styela clava TaxID=7725 RepID=UPI001939635F|nr:lactadherin-like [Styela clava]